MPTIQQLLESQEKDIKKVFSLFLHPEIIDEIVLLHKQSIIALYEAEIANLEKILANYETENNSYVPFARLRKDLQKIITHYKQVIEELKK